MSKAANVSYVDFQKKKNISEKDIYNTCYDKWLDIKRACDPSKTIAYEAITFIAAIEFLFSKNPDEVIFNSKFLQSKCKQGTRQRSRFLAQLADLYEITSHTSYNYKEKEYHFVYSAKRTKDSLEILKNPKEFYRKSAIKLVETPDKNDLHTSQKCLVSPTNLSAIHIANPPSSQGLQEHRNSIEEDKNSSYAKSLLSSKKEKILKKKKNDKHATFAPCSRAELEQVALKSENQNKPSQSVTNCDGLQPSQEIPKMKQDDIMQDTDEQIRKMLLSQALWKALGTQRSGEIQDSWVFRELEPDKVGIYMGSIRFSDMEKEKVPEAIKSVYGENVKIIGIKIGSKGKQQEPPTNENVKAPIYPISKNKKATWLDFKATIKTNSMITMLTNPVLKTIEIPGKVIIETVPFLIERLTSPGYLDELERSVFETGLTLELRATNPHPEYKNFNKEAIVISPEKILKDMEFRESCEPLVLSKILKEAIENKEE
jgi:hypothetical protein